MNPGFNMVENTYVVALVDNNDDDVVLFCRALKAAGFENPVIVLRSGEEAVRYFKGEGAFSDREKFPLPRLLLVDKKLSGISGLELLAWLRLRDELNGLPIIMMTGSHDVGDIMRAYSAGASSFVTKSSDPKEFKEQVRSMAEFWLRHSQLPPQAHPV